MHDEYLRGEEGVDYTHIDYEKDPRFLTDRKLRKIAEKQATQAVEEMFGGQNFSKSKQTKGNKTLKRLSENIKKIASMKVDPDEIKFYPGSEHGIYPEEDPKSYIQWARRNLPGM